LRVKKKGNERLDSRLLTRGQSPFGRCGNDTGDS